MSREMHEKQVTLENGLDVHYHEWPGVGPKLLFLHPSVGYGRIWEWTADAFGDRFHIFAPDQRGHGRSSRPDGDYSAEEYATDAVLFMDAVGIERAVVVGHSLGGRVAQVLSARYPKRVSALILVASPHLSNFHVTRQAAESVLSGAAAVLEYPDTFATVEDALAFMRARWPWSPETEEALAHRIKYNFAHGNDGSVSPLYDRVRVAQGLSHLSDNLSVYAPQVECPVAILRATTGNLSPEQAKELSGFWRDARIVDVEGKYALQLENPSKVAEAIVAFTADIEIA